MSYDASRIKATWTEANVGLDQTFAKFRVTQYQVRPLRGDGKYHYEAEKARATVVFELDGRMVTMSLAEHPEQRQNLWVIWQAIEAMRLNRVRGLEKMMSDAYKLLGSPAANTAPADFSVASFMDDLLAAPDMNVLYRKLAQAWAHDAERLKALNIARDNVLVKTAGR